MSAQYDDLLDSLREAYAAKVDERQRAGVQDWKQPEREAFLARLRDEQRVTLLEVGAGTGVHGRYFADEGLDVVCTDLSPVMVDACRANGLEAHVQDFLHLDLGRSFDAAFAMNCLLHVPIADLPRALERIAAQLTPGGLFFWGQYGGVTEEGTREQDDYEPKRFFSSVTDEQLVELASAAFDIVDFHAVDIGWEGGLHFQSATLRRR